MVRRAAAQLMQEILNIVNTLNAQHAGHPVAPHRAHNWCTPYLSSQVQNTHISVCPFALFTSMAFCSVHQYHQQPSLEDPHPSLFLSPSRASSFCFFQMFVSSFPLSSALIIDYLTPRFGTRCADTLSSPFQTESASASRSFFSDFLSCILSFSLRVASILYGSTSASLRGAD